MKIIALLAAAVVAFAGLDGMGRPTRALSAAPEAASSRADDDKPHAGGKEPPATAALNTGGGRRPAGVWLRELRIRVVDESDRPIERASVALRVGRNAAQEVTDDEGFAALTLPETPPDSLLVTVDAEPFVRVIAEWQPTAIPADMPPAEFVVRLAPGRKAGGVIVDEQRRPVQGAKVTLHVSAEVPKSQRLRPADTRLEAVSTADGTWSVSRLPNEIVSGSLQVTHPDFVSDAYATAIDRKALSQLFESKHERVVKPGASVFGRVTDSEGKPVAEAIVALGQHMSVETQRPLTDAQGRYRIEHCLAGQNVLTAIKPGLAPEVRTVTVSAVNANNEFDFQLKPGHSIRIRVTDKEGKPVKGANVYPDTWRNTRTLWTVHTFGETDANGVWAWTWAPDEEIQYDIYRQGSMRIRLVALRPAEGEHELTLLPELLITGNVVDDATGRPVPAFRVTPGMARVNGRPSEDWTRYETVSGTDGKYSIRRGMPCEAHALRIEADGYLPAKSRNIRNDEGEVTIDFRLKPGRQPQGTVLSPEGMPEENARVILGTVADRPYIRATGETDRGRGFTIQTGADGRFALPAQSEKFTVYIFGASGFAQAKGAEFEKSPDEPLPITLKPWARISGTVRTREGPAPDQPVRLAFEGNMGGQSFFGPHAYFDYGAKTDAQGRFRFDRVPPETKVLVFHSLEIRHSEGAIVGQGHSAQFKLAAGQIRSIVLGGKGRSITGRVEVPSKTKIDVDWETQLGQLRPVNEETAADVVYRPPAAFRLEHDGTFRIDGVAPGRYVLSIAAMKSQNRFQPRGDKQIGRVQSTTTVSPVEEGESDEPVDVGTLTIMADQ